MTNYLDDERYPLSIALEDFLNGSKRQFFDEICHPTRLIGRKLRLNPETNEPNTLGMSKFRQLMRHLHPSMIETPEEIRFPDDYTIQFTNVCLESIVSANQIYSDKIYNFISDIKALLAESLDLFTVSIFKSLWLDEKIQELAPNLNVSAEKQSLQDWGDYFYEVSTELLQKYTDTPTELLEPTARLTSSLVLQAYNVPGSLSQEIKMADYFAENPTGLSALDDLENLLSEKDFCWDNPPQDSLWQEVGLVDSNLESANE